MDSILQEAHIEKEKLIKDCNTIFIGSVNQSGEPNASYAPTHIDEDCNFYIYISALAKHTKNILDTGKISFMLVEPKSQNIFAKKRITFNGQIKKIERKSEDFNTVMGDMRDKLGETIDMIRNMEDFSLIKITPISGLLVYGFAKAFILTGKGLNEIKHLNDIGHTEKNDK